MIRQKDEMKEYQLKAEMFLDTHDAGALWVDMGLGKTVITLTGVVNRLKKNKQAVFFLFAPIRVIRTVWRQEAKIWAHTQHLKFSLVYGNEKKRYEALRRRASIYLVNYENIQWLFNAKKLMRDFPKAEGWILDESSLIKSPKTKRFKTLRKERDTNENLKIVWELTGRPAPNSYLDIWSQIYLLDKGKRLTKKYDTYRDEFFKKDDYMGYRYAIRSGSTRRIERLISPLVLRLDASDYIKLPKVTYVPIKVRLPDNLMEQYNELEKKFFLQLDDVELEVFNAAALSTKLWQFANGVMYIGDEETGRTIVPIHEEKLKALDELMSETYGESLLISYWFKTDLARLKEKLGANVANIATAKDIETLRDDWNAGKVDRMLIHPAGGAHGLNLQYGGHILIFYSLTWSLDYYDQLVKRLDRQGQTKPVFIYLIMAESTIDEAIMDAIDTKSRSQTQLLNAIRRYQNRKTGSSHRVYEADYSILD